MPHSLPASSSTNGGDHDQNTFEIYASGTQITVKMNGVVTASISDGKTHAGRIGLQFNGGPIKFRKLLVREL